MELSPADKNFSVFLLISLLFFLPLLLHLQLHLSPICSNLGSKEGSGADSNLPRAAMRQEDEEEGVGRGCSLGPSNGVQCRTERESTTAKVGHPSSVFSSSRHRHLGSIFQPISDLPSFLPALPPQTSLLADLLHSQRPHPDGSVVNRSHERQ